MAGLTPEQIDRLKAPFPLDAHELRDGGGDGKLAFLSEEPVTERLTEIDPNWEFTIHALHQTDYRGTQPDSVTAHASLTICGVTRHNVGASIANSKTREWDKSQNKYVPLETPIIYPLGEMELKGATTDALKRCARMFGVGTYLLRTKSEKFKSDADFERWFAREFPEMAQREPAAWTKDAAQIRKFEKWLADRGLTDADANTAMGIDDWRKTPLGGPAAVQAVNDYIADQLDSTPPAQPAHAGR